MISDNDSEVSEEEDSSSFSESFSVTKEDESPSPSPTLRKGARLTGNVSDTKYPVVKYVLRRMCGWRLKTDPEDTTFDLWWTDDAVEAEKLAKMQPFQKINHFPGMYALARKNFLARNLTKLRKVFPDDYDFYPQTWVLPAEFADLKTYSLKQGKSTYIVKPDASSQGRGIFLTKNVDDLSPYDHFIVQRYIEKPFLIEDLKFDLRIYVLVAGCDPLRIFLHEEGLTRLATEEYTAPSGANLSDMCMHLTNYAVNKNNPNFVFNEDSEDDDVGHKRSLTSTMRVRGRQLLEEQGYDVGELKRTISDIIIKTLCTVQPSIAHYYKSCQPEDFSNSMCFELLGFDILLDRKLKPWLLEVNHSPSFTTDTPLDEKIKRKVIGDTITLLNFNAKQRKTYLLKERNETQQRTLLGKSIKLTKEEREIAYSEAHKKRDDWEAEHLGGFTKIYPGENRSKYDPFLKAASEQWEEWTGANISRVKREEPKKEDAWMRMTKRPLILKPKTLETFLQSNKKMGLGNTSAVPTDREPLGFSSTGDPELQVEDSHSEEKKSSVFERLSKVKNKKPQDPVSHSIILPNIYFSDIVSHGLLYVPAERIYRPPSEVPVKGKQCLPPQSAVKKTRNKEVHIRIQEHETLERNLRNLRQDLRPPLKIQTFAAEHSKTNGTNLLTGGMFVMPKVAAFNTRNGITPTHQMEVYDIDRSSSNGQSRVRRW